MGAWGANIFDDDFALDLKSEYEEILGSDFSHEVAAQTLIERYQDALEDPEESGVFWLALASIQLEQNALMNEVRTNALDIIMSDRDLLRWEESELFGSRKQVLEQLKNQLLQKKL
jgi:hypothetical protein